MGKFRALIALAGLLGSPTDAAAAGPDFPTRADVERIMVEFLRCAGESCPTPPRGASVRNLRCMSDDSDWEFEGRTRVICVFSGRWLGPGLEELVMDCAYLWRGGDRGAWTFQASPDWDLCEDYEAALADASVIH
jgi:hypothetical protein